MARFIRIQLKAILFSFLFVLFCAASPWNSYAQDMEKNLYFENPVPITSSDTFFPLVVKSEGMNLLFFEEVRNQKLYISYMASGGDFSEENGKEVVAGPFDFSGEVPDIYSAASNMKGSVVAAVSRSRSEILVLVSSDGTNTSFSQSVLSMGGKHITAPRVFATRDGGFAIFVSLDDENRFSIAYSVSEDGTKWSELAIFTPSAETDNSFSPYLCPVDGGDLVVFQSHFSIAGGPRTFQLYAAFSSDGLKTFSSANLLTDDSATPGRNANSFAEYSNQSPALYYRKGEIWCAWERAQVRSDISSIALARLTPDGKIDRQLNVREYSGQTPSHRPSFFESSASLFLVWFDDNNAYTAVESTSGGFGAERLIKNSSGSIFVSPAFFIDRAGAEKICYIWQKNEANPSIYIARPDTTVLPPNVSALSFKEGKRSSQKNVRFSIRFPSDTSGIAGYSWSFSKDPEEEPSTAPEDVVVGRNMLSGSSFPVSVSASEEGEYFFKAKVLDFAGNWSASAEASFFRDLTPPQRPEILPVSKDTLGFVKDSSVFLEWRRNESDTDVEGYSWNVSKVLDIEEGFSNSPQKPIEKNGAQSLAYIKRIEAMTDSLVRKAKSPNLSPMQSKSSLTLDNCRNGVYVFSVRAVDEAGNAGDISSVLFIANKYIPRTVISGIRAKTDVFGDVEISVYGQGFLYEGFIDRIYVDKDGSPPYDRTLYLSNDEYKINSSSLISGIHLSSLDEGTYGIYLHHTLRGTEPENSLQMVNKFTIDESGVVKIEHPYEISASWKSALLKNGRSLRIIDTLVMFLVALCVFAASLALRGIVSAVKKEILIQSEVVALIQGGAMPSDKKNATVKISKRKTSLKLKMTSFTVVLVLAVVSMASVPIGIRMIRMQRRTLVQGMREQVVVLLEGMANSVQNAMNDAIEGGSTVSLIDLVHQADSFEPAIYATVMGRSRNDSNSQLDYFWSSTMSSSSISQRLDTSESVPGVSRFIPGSDESVIAEKCAPLEEQAHELVDELLDEIEKGYSKETKDKYTSILHDFSRAQTFSVPLFDEQTLGYECLDYTFYYPVFYKNSGDNNLLHAVIVLRVSSGALLESLEQSRFAVVIIAFTVTIAAALLGIIGSWLLASLIVDPIKRLEKHVRVITETADKKKLRDFSIKINTRDEIQTLGDSINEMTEGLVKAAEEEEKAAEHEKLALDGKSVQQTFLPLLDSEYGGKKTTAELLGKNIHLFGYYEGADAVSGDYFDYKNLDGRFYAIVKCDASGHGVPAALIMTVVATLFRKYFENWSLKTHGTSLDKLVVQINDFIESLGVKGKFAALLVCLFDTQTGYVHICNAGDNIVHLFDQNTRTEKTVTLHASPAAGALPSFLVKQKGGFFVDTLHLGSGDILFLYTDGIEEAVRFFRNQDFEVIKCSALGLENGEIHFTHEKGDSSEQFGKERVKDIIEAVLNRSTYILKKYHNPIPEEELSFDFSNLKGTVGEAIMALASVEKVFRMYKTIDAKGEAVRTEFGNVALSGEVVCVDRKIDTFLKETFSRYDYYCRNIVDLQEPNYIYYTGVSEDVQADDLTLLAIQKI